MNLRVEDVSVCVCVCVSRLTFGHTLDVKHGTPFCVVFASLSTWIEPVLRESTFFCCVEKETNVSLFESTSDPISVPEQVWGRRK